MIQSFVLTTVDIPSVANACADTSPRVSANVDSLYYAPLVPQAMAQEREKEKARGKYGAKYGAKEGAW